MASPSTPGAWRLESNGSGRRGLRIWAQGKWRWKANMLGELVSARINHPVLSFVVNFGEEGYTLNPDWTIYLNGVQIDKDKENLPNEVKNAPVVHFAIGCHNYANGTHSGHSLAATVVRRKHKIFFFNPWGRASMKNVVAGKLSTDVERPIQEINIMKYYDSIQFNGARNTKDNYLIDTVNEFSHGHFGIKIGTNNENERMGFSNIYPSPPSAFVYMGENLQARNVEKTGGGLCSGYSAIFLMNPDIQNAIQNDIFPADIDNGVYDEKLQKLIETRLRKEHCKIEQEFYLGTPTLSSNWPHNNTKTGTGEKRPNNPIPNTSRYIPVAKKKTDDNVPAAAIRYLIKCDKKSVSKETSYWVNKCNDKECVENLFPLRNNPDTLKLSNVQTVTCERGTRYVRKHDVNVNGKYKIFFHSGDVVITNGNKKYVPTHVGGLWDPNDVQPGHSTIKNFDRFPNWETHIRQISKQPKSRNKPKKPKSWRKLSPNNYRIPPGNLGGLMGSYELTGQNPRNRPGTAPPEIRT